MRTRCALTLAACSLLAGCTYDHPSPTYDPGVSIESGRGYITETFSGTLQGGRADVHVFQVAVAGTLTVTLTQSSASVGTVVDDDIATPGPSYATDGVCLWAYGGATQVGPGKPFIVPSVAPGIYCVEAQMKQVGANLNLVPASPNPTGSYTLTVTHP
jgi:hypothetical protein